MTAPMGRRARTVADRELMALMGERLRWVREALDLTQEQIAAAVGVHQTAWSLYELGKRWPDQFEAMRLIAKLQITREYLLMGSLEGVAPALAIRIAAKHPELVFPTGTARSTDTDPA